ncbi:MAG: formate dehydrogenase accessory sulfurtransferase FdhD [Firmicutes bacterium]|nr:formate dehydrogenase accessory sulfurtransferase FdhD [Bacillota bacterium]
MVEVRRNVPAPAEYPVTLYINGQEYVSVQATPADLEDFALGFLLTEGIVRSPAGISGLVATDRGIIWIDLAPENRPPAPAGLISDRDRGIAAEGSARLSPVPPGITVSPRDLAAWVGRMAQEAIRYRETRGIHACLIARPAFGEWLVREDIGRHNAVDKAIGAALRRGWDGPETVVCTSGRISYEMCVKAARFGTGIVASRTAATDMACDLADRLGMDLVGYVRTATRYTLYTSGRRLAG